MGIKGKLRRYISRKMYHENASSEDLLNYLRDHGARIGTHISLPAPNKTLIDKTNPWLLTIGDRVRIGEGVKILTHDYSWSVLKCYDDGEIRPGNIMGAQNAVSIGSNVFIGVNAVVLPGVTIADNVIIGAGSIVTKDCQPNSVYAGNPARWIMSIEDFYHRREKKQFAEARELAVRYRERFGKLPPQEVFGEYFMLFSSAEEAQKIPVFRSQMSTSGNLEECIAYMENREPMFADFHAFLEACFGDEGSV